MKKYYCYLSPLTIVLHREHLTKWDLKARNINVRRKYSPSVQLHYSVLFCDMLVTLQPNKEYNTSEHYRSI